MNLERQKNRKIFNQIDKLSSKGKNYVLDYYRLIDEIIAKGDYGYFESTLNEYFKIDINHYQTVQDVKKKTWDKIVLQSNDPFSKRLKKLYDRKNVYQVGYNIFTNSTGTLMIGMSQPLNDTYNPIILATQSISTLATQSIIQIGTDDASVYRIDLYKCDWQIIDNVDQPVSKTIELVNSLNIYATQSWYDTDISIYGHEYLLKTHSSMLNDFNYKLSISQNKYLGKIIEQEIYTIESKYYVKNKQLAKLKNLVRTNLEVEKSGTYSVLITNNDPSLNEDQNLLNRYEISIDYLLQSYDYEYIEDYFLEDYVE